MIRSPELAALTADLDEQVADLRHLREVLQRSQIALDTVRGASRQWLWPGLVAVEPRPALSPVPARGRRDDVRTAALAEERDGLFSVTPPEFFDHRENACVSRPRRMHGFGAAPGSPGAHFHVCPDATSRSR